MEIKYSYLELVEMHERKWGTQQYPGRPTLSKLMKAPYVALWTIKGRFIFTVHGTPYDLNELVYHVLVGDIQEMPDRKLVTVYYEQTPFDFRVRLVAYKPPQQSTSKTIPGLTQPTVTASTEWLPEHPLIPHSAKLEPLPKKRQHSVEYGDHVPVKLPDERSKRPGRHITESPNQSVRLFVVPEDHKVPDKATRRTGETEDQFQERMYREKMERIARLSRAPLE
jgi:hypothetical protein